MQASYGFGATLDLDLLGIEVSDDTLIPGLAVASSRAKPLAGNTVIYANGSSPFVNLKRDRWTHDKINFED